MSTVFVNSQLKWLMPGFGDKLCNTKDELKLVWLCKRIENMGFLDVSQVNFRHSQETFLGNTDV